MKKFLLSVLTSLCALQSFGQSLGNETCATAVTVPTNGTCITGNNIGADAVGDPNASCFSVENAIWFKFVAPQMGPVTITNNDPGTNFNTQLALFTGTCGSLTEVVCENDNGVAAGKATINSPCVIPGQTYYVMLDGYAGATGTYCIKIIAGNSPSNDNCQCPIPLPTDGSCVNGTTLNATNQWGSLVGCQSAASNVEVWYSFTATQTGMTFNLSGGASGPLTGNGEIIVARGTSCSAITTIAGSSCGPLPLNYTISGLVVGAQYYVTISNPPSNSGSFVLCGTSVIPPVIPGQDCPNASVLCTTTPINQPTSNGGYGIQEVNTTNSCWGTLGGVGQGERQSRWYKFTVGCTGPLTFHIRPVNNNDDYDWAIWNITTAGCPTLTTPSQTSVACNWQGIGGAPNGSTGMTSSPATACSALGAVDYTADPSCDPYAFVNTAAGGGTSTYTPYTATAGQTFALLIDNFTATNGGFTLTWGPGVIIGPDPQFTITNPACTRGITVTKSCATTNSNLVWDFGDGITLNTTSSANQTHTYAADGTYNVTLTITDALGCVRTITKTVIITTPPPAPTVANVAICSGNTATVTASAPGGLYQWYTAATGGTLLGSEASYTTPVLTANATYYVQTTINGCTSPRTIVTVTVNPNPAAATGPAKTICGLTSTTIGVAPVGTNTYSWVSNPVGFTSSVSNPTVSPSVTTTYTLTETIVATGCTATNSVLITVTPVPVATATPASSTICSGTATSIALTSNVAGTTYAWTVSTSGSITGAAAGSGATIAQTLTNTSATAQTATYTITPTAGGCAGAPISVVITVNPRPTVTATPSPSTICSGNATSIALTSNVAGATFAWTITTSGSTTGAAAGSGATIAQTITNTSTVAQTVTYNVTPTAAGCAGTPVAVVVTINPRPVATATPASQSFCSGGTTGIALTSNVTGTTFSWTVATSGSLTGASAGSGANIAQTLTNTSATAQTATYTITPTANSCPGTPITVVITVNPQPVVTATPASDLICSGTAPSIALTSNVAGTTFAWTVSISAGTLTGASAGSGATISQTLTNTSTVNQTATYTITPTAGTCAGTPITVVITVKPRPIATATPSPSTICSGNTTSVALTSNVAGTTFAWTVTTSGSITGASAGSGATIAQTLTNTSSVAQTATYTITPTAAGCAGTPITVVVTVNPTPVVTATPASQTFCSGSTTGIALTSNVAGSTFSWTVATSSGLLTGAAAGTGSNIAQTLTNISTAAQTATYTITPLANACSGTPITVVITVNPIDNPAFNYASSTYCVTGTDPSATITGGATGVFTSSPAGLVFLNTATGLIDLSASTAPVTYTITFTTNGVCPSSSTFNLTITTAPNASFSYAGPYCSNGTNPTPTFPAGASAGTFTSTAGLVFVSATTGQINLSASTPGTYTVTNTIAAGGGCAAASANNTVTITPAPLAPTVITPVTYCQNAAATPLTATGSNLLWYTAPTGGVGSATAPTPITTVAGTTSYYVSQTVSGCEGPRAIINVIVNPTPVATATPNTQIFCSGGTTSIALTSTVAGSTFNWTVTTSAATLTGASAGSGNTIAQTLSNSSNTNQTATYTIIPTANACPGAPITVTITVKPTPVATAAPSPQTICSGITTSVALSSTVAGTTFDWTVTTSSASLTGTSAGVGSTISQTLSNSSTTAQTATYTVTPTANGCPGAPIITIVTVNPIPAATATPAAQTICSNQTTSIALTSPVAGTTFAWTVTTSGSLSGTAAGSGNTIAQTLTNTSSNPQTATYTIIPTANSCSGAPITVIITVNPLPFATATPAASTICSGSTTAIALTSNVAGSTFTWTVTTSSASLTGASAGSGNTIAQALTNSSNTAQTATYTITPSANSCATATPITVVITVNPTPVVTATPPAQTICSGAATSIALTSNVAGTTFAWIVTTSGSLTGSAAGSGSSIAQTLTNTSTTAQTATYTITPTASGCPGTPITVVITVNPTPVATATPAASTICSGSTTSIALTSNVAGSTFTWTVATSAGTLTGASAGSGNTIAQTLSNSSNTAQTATYTITPSANSCASATPTTVVITVNPTPVATATPAAQTICSEQSTSIALTSSVAGTTFAWTVITSGSLTGAAAGSGSSISQTLTNTSTTAQTATYTITPTANGCTGAPITVVITVNPLPVATATPAASTICSGSTTSIALTSNVTGSTFTWTVATSGSITGAAAGSGNTIAQTLTNTSSTAQTVTYTITPSASSCASATPTTVVITVNPTPVATAAPASQTLCSGATTSIALNSNVAGVSFSWTVTTSSASLTGASAGSGFGITQTLTNSTTTAQTATYTITPTANGCPGAPITVVITVNPTPVATATPAAATICSGSTTSIALTSNVAGSTFTWTVATSSGTLTGASAGSGNMIAQTLTNSSNTAQTATYTITPSANSCATATPTTVVITVNPTPVVTATPAAQTICSGQATSIALTSPVAGTTFAWTVTTSGSLTGAVAGLGANIAQTLTNTSTSAQTATYTITPTASGCPGTPITVVITVNPVPVATATPAATTLCSGGTTSIALTSNVAGSTFTWTVATSSGTLTGASAGSGNTIAQTLTNSSSTAQTATYTITPSANSCASATPATVVITVNPIPVATATPAAQTICSEQSTSIALTSNVAGTTFSWTVSTSSGLLTGASAGSGSSIAQLLSNSTTTPQTATYTIIPTANSCPGAPITVVITVNPLPVATATPGASTICSGSTTSIALTSNVAGSTYTWTVSTSSGTLTGAAAGSGNTIAQTLSNSSSTAQTATYTITPSANSCGSATPTTVVITVNPTPVVTATPAAQTFCSGGTTGIALTSNVAGSTFSWTVTTSSGLLAGAAAGTGSNIAQTLTNTSTTAQTATYTITPLANACPGTPITVVVTVNPIDNPAFNYASSTYCVTGTDPSATITGGAAGVFTSSPAGLVFLNTATGLIDLSASNAPITYTVTFTTNGVCPSTSTFNVTITTSPSAAFSYAGPYCSNAANPTPTFPAGSSAGTFTSTVGLVFVSTTTGQINLSASTAGTYTVTNTIAAGGGCAAAVATSSVTIIASPLAPTVTTPVTYCQNAAATPLTATGSNLLWYTAPTGGVGSATAPTPVTTTAGTTSYYVSQTSAGCESPRAIINVIVNPTPVATATPNTQIFCSGGTTLIDLTSTVAGTTFSWTVTTTDVSLTGASAGSGNTIAQTLSNSSSTDQTVTYTITPSASACPGAPITVTITVKPTPVATSAPSPQTICSGSTTSVALSSTVAGTTFDWTVTTSSASLTGTSAGVGSTISQTLSNSSTTAQTATYTATPTANGCPGTPIISIVTVNPIPAATATPAAQTICSDQTTSIALTSSVAGTTFSWTVTTSGSLTGTAAGSGSSIAQTLTNTSTTSQTATYTIIPTANSCPGAPITVVITVDPLPVATATPDNATICSGSTTAITLTSNVAGSTFTWTVATSGSITGAAAGSGNTIAQTLTNTSSTAQTVTYTITPSANSCASSTPTTVVITVDPTPVVTATPANQTICSDATTSIALSSSVTGTIFSWTVSTSSAFLTGASAGSGSSIAQLLSNSTTSPQTVTYTIIPTANSCPGSPITVVITVNPLPVATASPAATTICSGGTIFMPLTSDVAGSTFTWTVTTSSGLLTGATAGSGNTIGQTLSNTSATPETATYTITPSANSCATATPTDVVITVNPIDNASFNYSSTTFCQTGTNPTPTITGSTGGIFTSSPAGLSMNSSTGVIDLAGSTLNTYTVTYTTPGPCVNTATFSITVTTAPSAVFSFAGGAYCQSGSPDPFPTFVTGASGGTFSSTAGLNIDPTTGQITLATSTPGTYIVTNNIVAADGCAASSDTSIVIIDQPATVNAGADSSICAGNTFILSGSMGGSASSITWSSPSGGTFDDANLAAATYTPSAADISSGSVILTITSNDPAGSCGSVSNDILLTIEQPPIVNAGVDSSVCSGNTFTLSGTSGGSATGVTWSSPSGGTFDNANSATAVYTPSASDIINGSVILTITSNDPAGNCNAVTDQMTLTIDSLDNATFNYGGTTFCATGSNPSPTITGISGGTFTSSGAITIDPSTGVIDLSTTPIGTYTITYTTNGACPNSDSITISISTSPAASFSYTSGAYCQSAGGLVLPVLGGGSGTGVFSSGSGLSLNASTGEIDIALSTPGTYTVYNNIPVSGGCAATVDSATIIIDQPATANAGSDTAICAGTTLNVSGAVTGTTGLTWSSTGSGSFASSTSASTVYSPSSADSLAGSVMLIVTSDDPIGSCNAVADTMLLTINSLPNADAGTSPTLTCVTTSALLNGSSTSSGTSFFWSGPGIVSGDSTAAPVVNAAGMYTLTVTNSSGCSIDDSVEVFNNITLPDVNAGAGSTLTCISTSAVLNAASTTAGASYSWTGPGIVSGDSTATPTVNAGGTYTVTVTDSINGCTATATVVVIDDTTPPIADAGLPQGIGCGITSAILDGSGSSSGVNISYVWTTTDGNIASGDSTSQATVDLNGLYTITVFNSTNGCFATDTVSVVGAPGSTASFTSDVITGTSPLTVNFINTSQNANTYIWYFGDSLATTATSTDTSFIYTTGTYTVTLVASNNFQCPDSAQLIIIVIDDFTFVIPNIFTPNGDDINDIFKVTSTGLQSLKANVYDRWGLKLYEWDGISGGWDGRTASGVTCPDGTYYYLMTVIGQDGKERFFKGYFQLNR